MTRNEALAMLPPDAAWSCSFGYPGEGGFCEFYRTPGGERFTISNGPYDAFEPFDWTCAKVVERDHPALVLRRDNRHVIA